MRVACGAARLGFSSDALRKALQLATAVHDELLATYPESPGWGRSAPDAHALVEASVAAWLGAIRAQLERFGEAHLC